MRETVVLLHGLLMRRPALVPMALRLRRRGFAPRLFGYSTLLADPDVATAALAARLRALGPGPVHLLAHSLGGLIALETLRRHPGLPVGRVVCLGSPIAGSAAARGLEARGLAWAAGRSGGLLRAGLASVPTGVEVGMVAGTRRMGLGKFFGRFEGDSDGTVAVAETRLPGLAAHALIHASHSGLILSRDAADLAALFFRTGAFSAAACTGDERGPMPPV
jgi:pimeloyl-ACP methyl ester carboxylesterase